MIEQRGTYNTQWTWMNNYNNADEELFSDYQRPRDHEWFKIRWREWVWRMWVTAGTWGSGGSKWGAKSVMSVKLDINEQIQPSSDANLIPSQKFTVVNGGWNISITSSNNIKIAQWGRYIFTCRSVHNVSARSNSWCLVIALNHWGKYNATGSLFDWAILYGTAPDVNTVRQTPMTITGIWDIKDWEEITLSLTCPIRDSGSCYVTLASLRIALDIIKIW